MILKPIIRSCSIAAVFFLLVQAANAQPCNKEWSLTENAPIRNRNRPQSGGSMPSGVYKVEYDKKNCGCKNPRIAVGAIGIKNGYPATMVSLRLKGYTCSGEPTYGEFLAHNVKTGEWDGLNGPANVHFFKDPIDITVARVELEYYDEDLKAKYRYVTDYETGFDETYINDRPLKDILKEAEEKKKEEAEQKEKQRKTKEEETKLKQAQQEAELKQKQEEERRQQEEAAKKQAEIQAQQQQQYQQLANTYQQQAQNQGNGAISQAYNTNMAKISAAGAGNTEQVQAIQQQQDRAMQQQLNELGTQLGNLVNLLTADNSPGELSVAEKLQRDDQESVRIYDQVNADLYQYQFDKYGHRINSNDVVVNNEKQNLNANEMFENGVVENGKFHNSSKAMEWFVKAANKNSARALVRLAKLSAAGGNVNAAVNLYLKAALLIDALSENPLANMLEFDNIKEAIKTLSDYDKVGYLRDENFNKFEGGYTNGGKSNYLEAVYFQYKLIPYKALLHSYYTPENEIAGLFLNGDATLQKNVAKAVDYYALTSNTSKDDLFRITSLESLARIFETGNGVQQDPDKAISYYNNIISIAGSTANKDIYSDHIKEAKKAIKRCEKLKKGQTATATANKTDTWNYTMSVNGQNIRADTIIFELDKNGFITGTMNFGTQTKKFTGFMAMDRIHLFYEQDPADNGYIVENDLIVMNDHEIKGKVTAFKAKPTTSDAPIPQTGIDIVLSK